MEFSRQEYRSGLLFPPPGDLPDPGMEPTTTVLQEVSLPLRGMPSLRGRDILKIKKRESKR